MKEIWDFFIASTIGFLGWFFGGRDGFINVLLVFVIIDYVMGVMVAYMHHSLSSSVGFNGIFRKISVFFLVGIAHVVDKYVLGDTATLRTAVCLFYVANEGISILENTDALGLPIPDFLKSRLLNIKKQINKKGS